MPVDPHAISLQDAIALTTRWRQNMPSGAIKAARFDRIAFDTLLAQPGCAGVRIYLGMNDDHGWTYVMVGTDGNGKDIVSAAGRSGVANDGGDGGYIAEEPEPCPPNCDTDSPLDGGAVPR